MGGDLTGRLVRRNQRLPLAAWMAVRGALDSEDPGRPWWGQAPLEDLGSQGLCPSAPFAPCEGRVTGGVDI